MTKPSFNQIKGTLGNIIFYELRGKPCMRTRPRKIRQTRATKASAKLFGMAASMSAALRKGLVDFLPVDKDQKIQNRMVNCLGQWLRGAYPAGKGFSTGLPHITGFEFNEDVPLSARFPVKIDFVWNQKGLLVLHIPAFIPSCDITAPRNTRTILCKIAVASCQFDNPSPPADRASASFEISYNNTEIAAQIIKIPFTLNRGELGVVAISLHYNIGQSGKGEMNLRKTWLPADIVASALYL